jgi:signal transduction histidine kinase
MPAPRTAVPHPPEPRPFVTALRFLPVLLALTCAGALWTVAQVPESGRRPVAWYGGLTGALICGIAMIAVHALVRVRVYRSRLASAAREAERLADETVPAVVLGLRGGASANSAVAAVPVPTDPSHRKVLRALADEIKRGERMRAAAMASCANAAGRVQALSTSMLADLREMQHRHGEEVLGDLMLLDHRTAQAGRLADSIAVLTGARTGRRWTRPIEMESVLRGAVGRISDYQRVRLHCASRAAVAGHAAEGVMHALAELMDNATSFSPPTSEVHVYVEEVSAGVVVTIDDGGLVMSEAALARAQRAVSAEPLDLTSLSGTRLGLPVVGCLARKHGLTVTFRPSSRGGTGVVVMIPQSLIGKARETVPEADVRPAAAPDTTPAAATEAREPTLAGPAPVEPAPVEPTDAGRPATGHVNDTGGDAVRPAHGLPRRRRGQALAAASHRQATQQADTAEGETRPKPARPRTDPGARFAAFHRSRRGTGEPSPGAGPAPDEP